MTKQSDVEAARIAYEAARERRRDFEMGSDSAYTTGRIVPYRREEEAAREKYEALLTQQAGGS